MVGVVMRNVYKIVLVVLAVALFSACYVPPSPTYTPTSSSSGYLLQCQDIVVACGCHGYVTFGQWEYTNKCASGYHEAVPCYNMGYCSQGGQPWGTRCAC